MSLRNSSPDAVSSGDAEPGRNRLRCRLLVLAKEPLPGRVKTRLCPPFSPVEAAELATAAIADTVAAVLSAVGKGRTRGLEIEPILVLDGRPGRWLDELLDGPFALPVLQQRTGGLDARIAGAFADALANPCAGALLIGMDTPQVSGRLLVEAFERLTDPGCDAVLGLADDGGWWTMGLHRADDDLVRGVPMSTSETGQEQHARLESAGLTVSLLPQLRDVDTVADAYAAAKLAPRGRFAGTLTRIARRQPSPLAAKG